LQPNGQTTGQVAAHILDADSGEAHSSLSYGLQNPQVRTRLKSHRAGQLANCPEERLIEPGMCPAANSSPGRTSSTGTSCEQVFNFARFYCTERAKSVSGAALRLISAS
jgi:hypothetical protein